MDARVQDDRSPIVGETFWLAARDTWTRWNSPFGNYDRLGRDAFSDEEPSTSLLSSISLFGNYNRLGRDAFPDEDQFKSSLSLPYFDSWNMSMDSKKI